MNNAMKVISSSRVFARNITTTARREVQERPSAKFQKLKENQQRFQVEDGVPVYLKKGAPDKMLFQATTGLLFVGLAMTFKTFWDLSFGKSWGAGG
ncbi:uncharacterized protein LOC108740480 [Agrilus planipennis]|uniref:Uncharacterized protein LOC108740480 n=1 Tax=Agrilus planipennis TaxID=224129 RepID=A0A1W4X2F5_AGRPL|nr:uncharacterized protein LOC108740480 [Agrilus planipennis]